jgi:hypothetical protein
MTCQALESDVLKGRLVDVSYACVMNLASPEHTSGLLRTDSKSIFLLRHLRTSTMGKPDWTEVDGVRYARRLLRLAETLRGEAGGRLTQAHMEALWAATQTHGAPTQRELITLDYLVVKHGLADDGVGAWLEEARAQAAKGGSGKAEEVKVRLSTVPALMLSAALQTRRGFSTRGARVPCRIAHVLLPRRGGRLAHSRRWRSRR